MALMASSSAFASMKGPAQVLMQLAREASIEITMHDIAYLEESRRVLPAGKAL
jgi:hypothetical protein